jgi:hypothetical protein
MFSSRARLRLFAGRMVVGKVTLSFLCDRELSLGNAVSFLLATSFSVNVNFLCGRELLVCNGGFSSRLQPAFPKGY